MIKIGDTITRRAHGGIFMMQLKVTSVDKEFIHCGPWKFDKKTGAEIDEELGWGNEGTGSFIRLAEFE